MREQHRPRGAQLMLFVGVLAAVSGSRAFAEPRRYSVDPTASRMVIRVGKAGLFGFAGHEHEVIAPVGRGSGTIALDHVDATSVELTIDAAALRVTGAGEPPDDVPKVQKAMVGPDCLDVKRFPTIAFASSAVTSKGGAGKDAVDLVVRGTLTLHGQSRAASVPVHVVVGKDAVVATGTTHIRQSEFGIKPISVGGVVNVKDELTIEWHLVWRPAP